MRKPAAHRLHAGNICCEYANGSVRHVRLGDCEVLQHIYFAVRDRDWKTIPLTIAREEVHAQERSFRIELEVEHKEDDIDFFWRGLISGSEDGRIFYSIKGEARSHFLRNRIGLCVLHPSESCRGLECTLEHTGGAIERSNFPNLISPHQPFLDLRAIRHQTASGITSELTFGGDTFETEDQRNWSDASFKTYSTPLAIPYPAQLKRGDSVEQQIELRVTGNSLAHSPAAQPSPATITLDANVSQPMAELGTVWERDRDIGFFDYVRLDLDLSSAEWRDKLQLAAEAGTALEVAVLIAHSGELNQLRQAIASVRHQIRRLLLFDRATWMSEPRMLSAARGHFTSFLIGGGSNKCFAELNRHREIAGAFDFVAWPIDPQVHALDEETAVENLAGQRPQIETARSFANQSLHISPISVPDMPAAEAWAVVCAGNLLLAGARSLTFQRALPVMQEVARFRADRVLSCTSSHPLAADALILRKDQRTSAWVANFLAARQQVNIAGRPLLLDPHAVVRIELDV